MYHIPSGALVVPTSLSDLHRTLELSQFSPLAARNLPALSARSRTNTTTVVFGTDSEIDAAVSAWGTNPVVFIGEPHPSATFTIPSDATFGLLSAMAAPDGSRPVVIGDVHNCHRTLVKLLDALEVSPGRPAENDPLVVFVGDLVDKGGTDPLDVLTTLRLAHTMVSTGQAVVVRGNHEQMLMRRFFGSSPEGESSQRSLDALRAAHDGESLARWLGSLPLAFKLPAVSGMDMTVVHATPTSWVYESGAKARRLAEQSCLFGRNTKATLPGVSIHGHWEQQEVRCIDRDGALVVNVDTGACLGHKLSAFEATSIPTPGLVPSISVKTELFDLPV